jgi:hypothetical protein
MRRATFAALAAALALPAAAVAGGWATAGVGPPPPNTGPGDPWNAEITVLQHGVTPLDGISPAVIIRNDDTGATKRFAAKPTGEPGKYVATVVFPSAGTWRYEVFDGFTQHGGARTHTFAPVDIGTDGSAANRGVSLPRIGVGVLAAGLLGAIGLFVVRRRRAAPQPA